MNDISNDAFFAGVPVFTDFEDVTNTGNYRPLPDGWILALADIVGSTQAIEGGRYKDVNMAGASVISAVLNAVEKGDYPFVFGGDGALIALPGSLEDVAREALAAVQVWVEEDLQLTLRIAVVPLQDIRVQGLDVRVARYAASPFVTYAMFAGGGTSWAERQMKADSYGVDRAPTGTRPDLAGLSCRWNPIEARNGKIVSIIAIPGEAGSGPQFQQLVGQIVAISAELNRASHPVPVEGPKLAFSLAGINREAMAVAPKGRRFLRKLGIIAQTGLAYVLMRFSLSLGSFDADDYRRDLAGNSDFRKFDDGLKMTIDVDEAHLRRIEILLEEAQEKGITRYGLHRQDSALMTCFVPTPLAQDHIHFIDGASGGYAVAASQITHKKLSATSITP
ncbi:DUF3095 domain-containing protein [Rhizobium sp. Root1220]|uniref:DUF3095 domain-containing protein n=1 Tax=Rhizobium sp. Root1220 TaxID=1736432 RepID=UPI0006FD5F52|nr:DUF3095 domain-containing protein [Rhizobium sp. Root1220]KQV70428.1 adenylate cyclase [Rhizobium sp. Root1220]